MQMLKFVYYSFLAVSIIASLMSAYYWYRAIAVEVDLRYVGARRKPHAPMVDPGLLTLTAYVAAGAATTVYIQSSYWNRKAALYAAIVAIGVAGFSLFGFIVGQ
jgi:hypothetical protein